MVIDAPHPVSAPSVAERAIDTATDVSRTFREVHERLRFAVDELAAVIVAAQRSGRPLASIRAVTRQAPLSTLFAAFLLGVAVARRPLRR